MSRELQRQQSLKDYATGWAKRIEDSTLKPSAKKDYLGQLDHIIPAFGHLPLSYFDSDNGEDQFDFQQRLERFVNGKSSAGKAPRTIRKMLQCLHRIIEDANDRMILSGNAMTGKIKKFRLNRDKHPEERVRAMTQEQLDLFLQTARWSQPKYFHLWLFLARTGCRTGEALALEWRHIDLQKRTAHIEKKLWMPGGIETAELVDPKTEYSNRLVTLSAGLCDQLGELYEIRQQQARSWGRLTVPDVVFCGTVGKSRGTYQPVTELSARMRTVLKRAGMEHFVPHDLRHTYATLRINAGHNIKEVSRELGHASVSITLDTYSKWIRTVDHAAVDSLDVSFSRRRSQVFPQSNQLVSTHP